MVTNRIIEEKEMNFWFSSYELIIIIENYFFSFFCKFFMAKEDKLPLLINKVPVSSENFREVIRNIYIKAYLSKIRFGNAKSEEIVAAIILYAENLTKETQNWDKILEFLQVKDKAQFMNRVNKIKEGFVERLEEMESLKEQAKEVVEMLKNVTPEEWTKVIRRGR